MQTIPRRNTCAPRLEARLDYNATLQARIASSAPALQGSYELVISALFGLCRILQQACDKHDFCFLEPIGSCADPTLNV